MHQSGKKAGMHMVFVMMYDISVGLHFAAHSVSILCNQNLKIGSAYHMFVWVLVLHIWQGRVYDVIPINMSNICYQIHQLYVDYMLEFPNSFHF